MRLWNAIGNLATGVVMATSVFAGIVVVRREFMPRPAAVTPPSAAPRAVKGWERWAENGRLVGRADAGVRLIEFADFQCPACDGLEKLLLRFRKEYPEDLAIAYHYVPSV